ILLLFQFEALFGELLFMPLANPLLLSFAASPDDLKGYRLTGRVLRGDGIVENGLIDLVKTGFDVAVASTLNVSDG
ncbi:MAG: hypothetical protein EBY15_09105, partial [Gammaproteobacteria bacterium]|nr:hypothetical protein [Gammaproteobacteria bacterium]